jgi:hypothetical protein
MLGWAADNRWTEVLVRELHKGAAKVSFTITRYEEWEENFCDNCKHSECTHMKEPQEVPLGGGRKYIASGCMAISGGTRPLKGDNPYLRCECTEFK